MAIKITIVFLIGLAFGLLHVCEAQQPKRVPRIGYIASGDPSTEPRLAAFRRGLRDLGYIEGKNILVEYRYAEGKPNDPKPRSRTRPTQGRCTCLGFLPAIHAAKQATKTIPIVMVITQDPVATGFVDSLARPGGNITGSPGLREN